MLDIDELIRATRVAPGKRLRLKDCDPGWMEEKELRRLGKDELKERARAFLKENSEALAQAQELLWASDTWSVLLVFQAMDAAGKDGTIKHVMSGVNPQGCQVFSFKVPSAEELDHNFLWRYWKGMPERGRIGIFNRSYYEEVLVVRVHPHFVETQKLPPGRRDASFWQARYEDINALERHLVRNGTLVLKFFLHLSKAEQKRRLLARLDDPEKHWKFSIGDLAERGHWDDYMRAYEEMLNATSTDWAPWYVIPADHKFVTRAMVSALAVHAIRGLGLEYPKVGAEQQAALAKAREQLLLPEE
jgi:PPK2 family polyphosphate:nucleotide phosphotransferase